MSRRSFTLKGQLARLLRMNPIMKLLTWLLTAPLVAAAPAKLRWDATPAATGYRVWRGIDLLAEVATTSATVDLPSDRTSTLTVTAVNAYGESDHSDPIVLLPVTPWASGDMKAWRQHPPFFVVRSTRQFFRFSFPSQP